MSLAHLADAVLVLAALPLVLGLVNLLFYRPLPAASGPLPPVSVLIPARNEEARIAPVLAAALASRGVDFEVVVADDSSTDRTAAIVAEFAARDPRLRLVTTPPLPAGWKGKNHACHFLSGEARHDIAAFLDADVTLTPDALARLAADLADRPGIHLISGFPRQVTESFWERTLIPLIHVVLLGYLPFPGVRFTGWPMFATACGQLIAVRIGPYRAVGGHGAMQEALHDGVVLPRLFRRAGYGTDLVDITDIAATRMYDNGPDVFKGLTKNAHEGMATPVGLPVWTTLLLGGHVLAVLLLPVAWAAGADAATLAKLALAAAAAYALRFVFTARFRQSWVGALLHPFGMAVLVGLQWVAFVRWRAGRPVSWKGRAYGQGS